MGGGGSTYDYGFRIYNPQIARFLSVDPLFKGYPWYTPYQFAGNKPINSIDLDGLEEQVQVWGLDNDGDVVLLFVINDRELIEHFYEQIALGNNTYGTFLNADQFHSEGMAPTDGVLSIHEFPGGSKHANYDEKGIPIKPRAIEGQKSLFIDEFGIISYGPGSFGDDNVRAKNTTWMEAAWFEALELFGLRKPAVGSGENPLKHEGGLMERTKDVVEKVTDNNVYEMAKEYNKQQKKIATPDSMEVEITVISGTDTTTHIEKRPTQ